MSTKKGTRRGAAVTVLADEALSGNPDLTLINSDPWVSPGENGENIKVLQSPTYALGRLTGIVRRSFMIEYVEDQDLSTPEWRVLSAVAEYGSLSFNEICNVLTMDRAQVSRTIGTLLPKGHVAQLTTARTKRRGRGHNLTQTRVILTSKGQKLYEEILPIAQQHQMILLDTLTEDERRVLHSAFLKMIGAAERFEANRAEEAATKRKTKPKKAPKPSQD